MDNALLWYVVLSLSLHTYNVKKLGKISTRGENVNGEKQNTSSQGWKRLAYELLKTERGFADAKPDRSPEEFLSVVPG